MEPGQTVKEGETLVVMEAMKMEVSEISVFCRWFLLRLQ